MDAYRIWDSNEGVAIAEIIWPDPLRKSWVMWLVRHGHGLLCFGHGFKLPGVRIDLFADFYGLPNGGSEPLVKNSLPHDFDDPSCWSWIMRADLPEVGGPLAILLSIAMSWIAVELL
ncbi:hypothetical protein ACLOJK_038891 [Asimina triloba]